LLDEHNKGVGGFVAIVLVPDLKYPANPPSVRNPETIGLRTELFFVLLAISVAAVVLAVALARRLSARYGGWNATLIAGAAFIRSHCDRAICVAGDR
jgi:hypothetical protein